MGSLVFLFIIFLSCLLQGITGFGFALLAAPLGLYFYDQKTLVVILTIISFVLNIYLLFKIEAKYYRKLAKHFLFSGLIGVPVGVLVLTTISSEILKVFAAIVAAIFGFILFRSQKVSKEQRIGDKNSSRNHKLTSRVDFVTGLLQSSVD